MSKGVNLKGYGFKGDLSCEIIALQDQTVAIVARNDEQLYHLTFALAKIIGMPDLMAHTAAKQARLETGQMDIFIVRKNDKAGLQLMPCLVSCEPVVVWGLVAAEAFWQKPGCHTLVSFSKELSSSPPDFLRNDSEVAYVAACAKQILPLRPVRDLATVDEASVPLLN